MKSCVPDFGGKETSWFVTLFVVFEPSDCVDTLDSEAWQARVLRVWLVMPMLNWNERSWAFVCLTRATEISRSGPPRSCKQTKPPSSTIPGTSIIKLNLLMTCYWSVNDSFSKQDFRPKHKEECGFWNTSNAFLIVIPA